MERQHISAEWEGDVMDAACFMMLLGVFLLPCVLIAALTAEKDDDENDWRKRK